jgi:hypothetical protein
LGSACCVCCAFRETTILMLNRVGNRNGDL